jgi:hypothetical protein
MWRLASAGMVLAAASAVLASGCAGQCGASTEKLAELQRGMSYEETSKIMGCSGALVSANSPGSGEASTVEWNGPDSIFMRTQIEFLEGRLLFFTTSSRTGF